MPDLSPDAVNAQLEALGLQVVDDEDLVEITHRVNALQEALDELEPPELDAQEPQTMLGLEERLP